MRPISHPSKAVTDTLPRPAHAYTPSRSSWQDYRPWRWLCRIRAKHGCRAQRHSETSPPLLPAKPFDKEGHVLGQTRNRNIENGLSRLPTIFGTLPRPRTDSPSSDAAIPGGSDATGGARPSAAGSTMPLATSLGERGRSPCAEGRPCSSQVVRPRTTFLLDQNRPYDARSLLRQARSPPRNVVVPRAQHYRLFFLPVAKECGRVCFKAEAP